MKNIITLLLVLFGVEVSFAGSKVGVGPAAESFAGSVVGVGPENDRQMLGIQRELRVGTDQVYFVRKNQAEIEFATNTSGQQLVKIQSLRVEEISNKSLLEGLMKSQISKQWESLRLR